MPDSVLPALALAAPVAYTFKGAWVSGNTYVGGNSAALSTECDVVTSSGVTYQHITSSSSSATAPASDTTNWQPLQFEIWKSSGPNSSTLPIYFKLVYTIAGTNAYRIIMSIGTGVDANGNLTNCIPMSVSAPTTVIPSDNSTSSSGSLGEMDMAGDADNVRFIMWRGHPTAIYCQTVVIDRARDQNGNATDDYWYCGSIIASGGGTINRSCVMPNPNIGLGPVMSTSASGWMGIPWLAGIGSSSITLFGTTPPLPISPLIGFVANPLLGCVGFHNTEVQNGAIMPVWIYGAVHSYMVNNTSTAALSTLDNVATNGVTPAILWE